jgi:glutathione S-transferase
MDLPILTIGNKNYSSWSMRPWLVLRWGGLPFEERLVRLGGEGYGRSQIPELRALSPSGRVPVLELGELRIWDSLAIAEWAAEQRPTLWPAHPAARALARSACAEMHSGFSALRRDLSMNIRRRCRVGAWPADTAQDLERLGELLEQLLRQSGGPWLLGERSIADAFYAPVATRLRTYGVDTAPTIEAWSEELHRDPDMAEWVRAAHAEPWSIASAEGLWPEAPPQ